MDQKTLHQILTYMSSGSMDVRAFDSSWYPSKNRPFSQSRVSTSVLLQIKRLNKITS